MTEKSCTDCYETDLMKCAACERNPKVVEIDPVKKTMPDIKEKLVEVLKNNREHYLATYSKHLKSYEEYTADRLIANGVTIQEWISVEERLPERGVKVLTYMDFSKSEEKREWGVVIGDNTYNGMFVGSGHRKAVWEWQSDFVTHWMPLPEPPKGK